MQDALQLRKESFGSNKNPKNVKISRKYEKHQAQILLVMPNSTFQNTEK